MKLTAQLKLAEKQIKYGKEKLGAKQILFLPSFVINVGECRVAVVEGANHIALGTTSIPWLSDIWGNFVQTNLQGTLLRCLKTSGEGKGTIQLLLVGI